MRVNAALKFRLRSKTSLEQLAAARAALAAERGDEDVLLALPKTVKRKHVHWTFVRTSDPKCSKLIKHRSRLLPLLWREQIKQHLASQTNDITGLRNQTLPPITKLSGVAS